MVRFTSALLILLASFFEECSSLGDPDLFVQVGYYAYTVYSLVLFIDVPTKFPTYDEWEFLMSFRAYSVDATVLPENSNTSFTCLYQCSTYSSGYFYRIVFMDSEAALFVGDQCADHTGDPAYQPICFPDDISGRSDFERIVVGDFFWPGYYSTSLVSWIQPQRHLPEGGIYDVGGFFSTPAPVVPSQAGYYFSMNFWTVTFNVWAQLKDTVFDSVCIAGYGLSESTGLCEICPKDTYRPLYQRTTGDCWLCPQNSTSDIGEIDYRWCSCDTGFGSTFTASRVSAEARAGRTFEKYCYACSPGEYGAYGSEVCEACPIGFYTALPSQEACTAATPGFYQPEENQSKSLACEAGTYSDLIAAPLCTECADGYFEDTIGSSVCEAAPVGYYTNGTGATEAIPCSPGYFKALAGAAGSCLKCPAGEYSAEAAAGSCTAAIPGYHVDQDGQSEALACGPGSFSSTFGSASCIDCAPGSFSNATAATSCELTTPGHFQNLSGEVEELPCPAGEFSAESGGAICEKCRAGSYSPNSRATACTTVLPGFFQSQAGQSESFACEPGTFAQTEGSLLCEDCEAGRFSNQSGSSRCTICSEGHFQNLTGKTFEYPCPPGSYNPSTGMSSCFACDPGQYASNYGQVRCGYCPRGTYGDDYFSSGVEYHFQTGTATCSQCPTISTTEEIGRESITACLCPQGTWGEQNDCVTCTEGMLCDQLGLTAPQQREGYQVITRSAGRPHKNSDVVARDEADFDVFRCLNSDACPQGPYGTCAEHRDTSAVACGRCLPSYHLNRSGRCAACRSDEAMLIAMSICIAGLLCLISLAFLANRQLATQSKVVGLLITSFGMAVAAFQIMSIFVNLSVNWLNPLKICLEALSFLSFDPRNFSAECLIGDDVAAKYGARQAVAPVAAIFLAIILQCKKRWYDHELRFREEYVNSLGAIMQMLFISILVSITIPFVCYRHPNGKSSLVSDAAVLCFEESGHIVMVGIGLIACCTVVLPFVVLVFFGVFRLPAAKRSSPSMMAHLRMFKFLFLQYEPHAYYFGVVALTRGLLVCFVPVVVQDEGAAQVLAIAAILLGFQICVRCVQPWSSRFSNGLDGALSALMFLLLLCVKLSGTFDRSDEIVSVVGLVCFIFAIVAVLFVIGVNLRRFARPSPFWANFVCHHKAHAGGQARYLQLTIIQMTGRSCFIDSDFLVNLDGLFDIVRSKIRHLLVYLTSDTLKRPWCAGEVTVAYLTHKRAVPLHTASFHSPSDDFISAAHILEYIAQSDFSLADYGLGEQALSDAFHWILHDDFLRRVNTRTTEASRLQLVGIVEDVTGAHSKEWRRSFQARDNKPNVTHLVHDLSSGYVVIAADPRDDEACAGAGIVMLKITQKVVEDGIVGVNLLHELPNLDLADLQEVPAQAHSLIIVLSEGSLHLDMQLHLVAEAMKKTEAGVDVCVVPLTLPSFRFPTQSYFTEYLPQHFPGNAQVFAMSIKAFFKRIAVQFAIHSSNQVLDAQAVVIMDRLKKRHVAGKFGKKGQGSSEASGMKLDPCASKVSATGSQESPICDISQPDHRSPQQGKSSLAADDSLDGTHEDLEVHAVDCDAASEASWTSV